MKCKKRFIKEVLSWFTNDFLNKNNNSVMVLIISQKTLIAGHLPGYQG